MLTWSMTSHHRETLLLRVIALYMEILRGHNIFPLSGANGVTMSNLNIVLFIVNSDPPSMMQHVGVLCQHVYLGNINGVISHSQLQA